VFSVTRPTETACPRPPVDAAACAFGIRAWSACAPGLHAREDWLAWSANAWLPLGDEIPPLRDMDPMLRRRVGPLGRATLHAAFGAHGESRQAPAVFASRHGEVQRSWLLLNELAEDQPLSPTSFGLSVHNAIGALYSMGCGHRASIQSIAAGAQTVEAAVVEAVALLADGAGEVLLVCSEAPLPPAYACFADEPECLYGWAWRLTRPVAGEPWYSLSREDNHAACGLETPGGEAARTLPHGLQVLRFMLNAEPLLRYGVGDGTWNWRRHV
jgi:hypothetical protein